MMIIGVLQDWLFPFCRAEFGCSAISCHFVNLSKRKPFEMDSLIANVRKCSPNERQPIFVTRREYRWWRKEKAQSPTCMNRY